MVESGGPGTEDVQVPLLNTSAADGWVRLLVFLSFAGVVAAILVSVFVLNKPKAESVSPIKVTHWMCGPTKGGPCVPAPNASSGYPTKAMCEMYCSYPPMYMCERDADGWLTGNCVEAPAGKGQFSNKSQCNCNKDAEVTVQCIEGRGCLPSDGEAPGPVWKSKGKDGDGMKQCQAECIDRYKCASQGVCSQPVITWDSKTYPIANSCTDGKQCAVPPKHVGYAWDASTRTCVSSTDSKAYDTFDQCMTAGCQTTADQKYYCGSARQCAASPSVCCGSTVCLGCHACQKDSSGKQFCQSTCTQDGTGTSSCYVCGTEGPGAGTCGCALAPSACELCMCTVKNSKTGSSRVVTCGDLASKLLPGDQVITCDFQRESGTNVCNFRTGNTLFCCGAESDPGVVMNNCKCAWSSQPPSTHCQDCNVF